MVKKGFKLKNLIIFLLIFAFVAVLSYMTPYMGDDWAWGSELGMERLQVGFKDYNGRYLGNLLVIALTRSQLLKAAVMACVITGTLVLMWQNVKHKSFPVFLTATVGFCVMPRYIFRQAIAWVSGFTNYAVPTFLIFAYLFIIKSIFDGKPKFKKGSFVLTFLLGASAALFMENITLYQLAADVLIIIGILIAYKKIFAPVISHFVGSLVGCVIMFTNGAYLNIVNSNDQYRTMETSSEGLAERIKTNLFDVVSKELALNNVFLNIIIAVVCIILVAAYFKKSEKIGIVKRTVIWLNLAIVTAFAAYSFFCATYQGWDIVLNYTKYFNVLFTVLFGIALLALGISCASETAVKIRLSFYILSVGILTVPLLVVTPIGSRCFFCGYMFLAMYVCEAFACVFTEKHTLIKNDVFVNTLLALCAFFAVYYTSIFGYIYKADVERNAYVQEQVAEGKAKVIVPELPYQGYLWNSSPTPGTVWEERYKMFHSIDQDIEFEIVKFTAWRNSVNK